MILTETYSTGGARSCQASNLGVGSMKRSLSGVFAALLITSNAYAADLMPAEPIAAPEVTVTEATGWYLRGDVGYGFNDLRGAKFFQGGSSASEASFDRA